MTFVNLSNHNSGQWTKNQINAAFEYGEIVDYSFPPVSANATEEDIRALSDTITSDIIQLDPAAVMCQGEFTLCYSIVKGLKKRGVKVLAACSERDAEEKNI